MRYYTIDKIDFGGGIKAILPKKIRVRRSDDSTQQYANMIYALLKQIPNVRFKKPNKKQKAVLDYVAQAIQEGTVLNVDDCGRHYVNCNGEKVYV